MGFRCGIVGLPNVGKSTLFNALTETAAAEAANYPFCTIEPNVGRVGVPDPRLAELARLAASKNVIQTQIECVDIAGLVKGASKGEGLGNQFLSNIREVDAIIHVVRCFENDDITHVHDQVDPIRDIDIIETELMLADMASLESQLDKLAKKQRGKDPDAAQRIPIYQQALAYLQEGRAVRHLTLDEEATRLLRHAQLLTQKPVLYVCNTDDTDASTGNALTKRVEKRAQQEKARSTVISAAIEAEIVSLDTPEERTEFLESMGLSETGLAGVIRQGYGLLDLITFFTVGPKEARSWTVRRGAKAPEAAGVIHTDFERGFICAETVPAETYIACGSEQAVKAAGKMRQEGRDYVVQDGDVFHFRFNV